jgi:hypothetical protein
MKNSDSMNNVNYFTGQTTKWSLHVKSFQESNKESATLPVEEHQAANGESTQSISGIREQQEPYFTWFQRKWKKFYCSLLGNERNNK